MGIHKTKIIAEIGVNHNGSLETALELVKMAKECRADFVKFQKRTPKLNVPPDEWNELRCTPFGIMKKLDYRQRVEFGLEEYQEIDRYCREIGIEWFLSVWDLPSLHFARTNFPDMPFIKIPSAMMEYRELQETAIQLGAKLIISTGMHTKKEIRSHFAWLSQFSSHIIECVMHCNSAYPTKDEQTNLNTIKLIDEWFPVGFSSHATSPFVPIAAIHYTQPTYIEVHITLDRTMKGSDHAASLERKGLELLVRERDRFYKLLGDGEFKLYNSERPARKKMKWRNG